MRIVTILLLLLMAVALGGLTGAHVVTAMDMGVGSSLGLTSEDSAPALITSMQAVSTATGGGGRLLTIVILALILWRAVAPRNAAIFVIVVALCNLATDGLKAGFDRARPDLTPHLDHVANAAFPSGHSSSAAVIGIGFALLLPPRWRFLALAAGALYAGVTGLSRIMLGVHWASDVIAGWMLGVAMALVASVLSTLSARQSVTGE